MIVAEASAHSAASPDAVWAVWTDWDLRPQWHPRLEWARFDGPAVVGTKGLLKPDRARAVAMRVTASEPGRRLVLEGVHGLPLARGHYEHEVVAATPDRGSLVTHRLRLTGPLAWPIGKLLGRILSVSATPEAVGAVANLAARASASSAGRAA